MEGPSLKGKTKENWFERQVFLKLTLLPSESEHKATPAVPNSTAGAFLENKKTVHLLLVEINLPNLKKSGKGTILRILFFFKTKLCISSASARCYLRRSIFSCSVWDLVPDQGPNPGPLHWEHGVLVTGPPGSPKNSILSDMGFGISSLPQLGPPLPPPPHTEEPWIQKATCT